MFSNLMLTFNVTGSSHTTIQKIQDAQKHDF